MRYAITQNFDSFEEFDAFPTGWDTRFQLVGASDCIARLQQSRSTGVLVNSVNFTGGTLQEGSTPSGMRTFALPLSLQGPLAWLGRNATDHSLLQFGDAEELFAVVAGGCDICTISIDREILDDLLVQQGVDVGTFFRSDRAFSLAPGERALLLRDIALLSEFLAKYGQHDVMPALSLGVQNELMSGLVCHLAQGALDDHPVRLQAAAQLVRSAITFMHEAEAINSVFEIGEALGASRRSLELSFKKYLGIPPKRYLKILRMHRCRDELVRSEPSGTQVGEVARRHGYWHMGQFGRDYRALFGERPSDTLARRR